jgi:hypothetical protein
LRSSSARIVESFIGRSRASEDDAMATSLRA